MTNFLYATKIGFFGILILGGLYYSFLAIKDHRYLIGLSAKKAAQTSLKWGAATCLIVMGFTFIAITMVGEPTGGHFLIIVLISGSSSILVFLGMLSHYVSLEIFEAAGMFLDSIFNQKRYLKRQARRQIKTSQENNGQP